LAERLSDNEVLALLLLVVLVLGFFRDFEDEDEEENDDDLVVTPFSDRLLAESMRLKRSAARPERGLQPASMLARPAVTEHQTVIPMEAA
jgi:hypothetical protein